MINKPKLLAILVIILIVVYVNILLGIAVFFAIPIASFYLQRDKREKAMVAINQRAAEEAAKVVELQTSVAMKIMSKIPKLPKLKFWKKKEAAP